jgi:hypothetical protein
MRSQMAVALVAFTAPLQRIVLSLHTAELPGNPSDANHVVGLTPRSVFAPTRSHHPPMSSRDVYARPGSDARRLTGVPGGQPILGVPYPPREERTT